MKRVLSILLLTVLTVCLFGCTSTGKKTNMSNFADGAGKDWKLIEVSIAGTFNREIIFDRSALSKEGAGNYFTLRYDAQNIAGTAAPNRYSAPYTLGENHEIKLPYPIRTTLMATIFQPEKLPEHEFYGYLQNVYAWRNVNGNLELRAKTEDDREVRLLFGL